MNNHNRKSSQDRENLDYESDTNDEVGRKGGEATNESGGTGTDRDRRDRTSQMDEDSDDTSAM